jgi:hypothetical protein
MIAQPVNRKPSSGKHKPPPVTLAPIPARIGGATGAKEAFPGGDSQEHETALSGQKNGVDE